MGASEGEARRVEVRFLGVPALLLMDFCSHRLPDQRGGRTFSYWIHFLYSVRYSSQGRPCKFVTNSAWEGRREASFCPFEAIFQPPASILSPPSVLSHAMTEYLLFERKICLFCLFSRVHHVNGLEELDLPFLHTNTVKEQHRKHVETCGMRSAHEIKGKVSWFGLLHLSSFPCVLVHVLNLIVIVRVNW